MNRAFHWPHPIIAREGWPFIALATVLALVGDAVLGAFTGGVLWLLALFVVQFFRDPARTGSDDPDDVLSPADGRIVAVEEADDVYAGRRAVKISVFMNVFNVHSNRMPVAGRIDAVNYFHGSFLNAALPKASLDNERNAVVIRDPHNRVVTAVQIAGLVARRILCYVRAGDQVERASRYGFIRFGSRVDVYLPLDARPQVSVGQVVHATRSVLARLGPPRA
ncbi:MAG: phosphatidylserine decarboxylase [Betaproteobacteria bacterium]|nr:phosphatidylserine decarboxylase [Betaproteobacteria bacterium]